MTGPVESAGKPPRITTAWIVVGAVTLALAGTALALNFNWDSLSGGRASADFDWSSLDEISAGGLHDHFAANGVRAANTFLGKWLIVSGVVAGVRQDDDRKMFILVATRERLLPSVICRVTESQREAAAALEIGDETRIAARVSGLLADFVQAEDGRIL
jgi:hypothetical protein